MYGFIVRNCRAFTNTTAFVFDMHDKKIIFASLSATCKAINEESLLKF